MPPDAFHSHLARILIPWLRRFLGAGILALAISSPATETNTANFAPPSSWVKPQSFNRQPSASLLDPGADQYLLLREHQVDAAENETFVHSAQMVLTPSGVQNGSTLTVDFNPGYQTLTIHWARIWRGAQPLDRLDTNSVKIVQREQDLDQFALNGEKSAVLVLDDVRVGDIIDFAYSIKGENPVFGNHFYSGILVQLGQPAERLVTRVVWPSNRRLYAKPLGCALQPVTLKGKESMDYIWDLRQVPGVALEDSLPMWCDPEPWVQLSDFKTWAEVNQWALSLFQVAAPASPELRGKIAEWKQLDTREQQILAALRFVQDDVRYFGIEIGNSTVKPADPSKVFGRRFGDCKDKSLLFVTILRALGLEAYPVLVNADSGRAIASWQPSAGVFDHCIAVVRDEGQTYWLDPTINYQRGSLAAHNLPGYDYGLVISPQTSSLTAIPQPTALTRTTTTEYFSLHGKNEPAELKVVTIAEGGDADSFRAEFAGTKRSEIERGYRHFYTDFYPGIKIASPIATVDDEQQNRFQITESYSINQVWTQSAADKKYRCQFYPSSIAALLRKPVDTDRKLPLGIRFPQHQILRTEVTLSPSLAPDTDRKTIFDPAFTLRKDCRFAGNKFVMTYEYQALTDAVAPDRVSDYLHQLDQASQALGYTIIWR